MVGVKWVLELKESNGILQSTDVPIVVFPESDTITPLIHPLRESQEAFEIEIPPYSRLRGAFVRLFVERQYRCEVKMCMKSKPIIYAGSLPDISLSIQPDVPNQTVLFQVVVSLCNCVETTEGYWTNTNQNSRVLAKWYPQKTLYGPLDLTAEFRRNLQDQNVWESDLKFGSVNVTHFLEYFVSVYAKWNRDVQQMLKVTCPVKIVPPVIAKMPPAYSS